MSKEKYGLTDADKSDGWVEWASGECPVHREKIVEVRLKFGGQHKRYAYQFNWGTEWRSNPIIAYRVVDPDSITAASVLTAAAQHMQDRAATYDRPEGERSMAATVAAFNAITGISLTEAQGWLFMAVLKQVRLFQSPGYHADSAEDAAAYVALTAEAKAKEGRK